MRDKEIVGLWEAYLQVHQPKEEVEQLDEFLGSGAQKFVDDATKKGGDILRKIPGVAAAFSPVRPGRGTVTPEQQKANIKKNVPLKNSFDPFDTILEYLVAEGYADTNESALAIMANMSEEWREEILDEAVRGSGRSIADRITGNDIRGVTRKGKTVYKKPKWKDEVENKVDRQFPSTRRTQTSNTYDGGRDSNTIKANKKSINRMNAAKNIEVKQADGDYENSIDHSKPYGKGKSGYMEVPTDYRARNRRARGR